MENIEYKINVLIFKGLVDFTEIRHFMNLFPVRISTHFKPDQGYSSNINSCFKIYQPHVGIPIWEKSPVI